MSTQWTRGRGPGQRLRDSHILSSIITYVPVGIVAGPVCILSIAEVAMGNIGAIIAQCVCSHRPWEEQPGSTWRSWLWVGGSLLLLRPLQALRRLPKGGGVLKGRWPRPIWNILCSTLNMPDPQWGCRRGPTGVAWRPEEE